MKKYLFSMLSVMIMSMTASAQDSDLSAMSDAIYVESATIPADSQQTLYVKMKNSIEVQTIQFDLYLPEGLSFVANEDSEWMTASKERINKFNYFECSIQQDGALRLLAQATTTNIAVGEGEIAKVIVSADANMTLGDYPVEVKNILIVSKDNTSKNVDVVRTTVTIGEPADTRTVLDETSTTAPVAATGVDVRVKRTILANEWSTICLPFAMTAEQVQTAFGDDVQLGDFAGYTTTEEGDEIVGITVNFDVVTAIEANHPYIIKVSDKVTEFTVDGVTIEPEDNPCVEYDNGMTGKKRKVLGTFAGTYVADFDFYNEAENYPLFLNGNKFYYATEKTMHMKAFRGYFDFTDYLAEAEGASSRIAIMFDNGTGIHDNKRETINNDRYYDLQGRRVSESVIRNSEMKKGLYIVNGKKVIK